MFQMPLQRIKNYNIFAKQFWNQSINWEVMAWTNSVGHTHAHIYTRTHTKFKLWRLYLAHRQRERRKKKEKKPYKMIFEFVQPYPYNNLKSVLIGLLAS